jgi:hypothetical protein
VAGDTRGSKFFESAFPDWDKNGDRPVCPRFASGSHTDPIGQSGTITSKALTAGYSATLGPSSVSAEAHVSGVNETAKKPAGETTVQALNADASAHASASLATGISAGAGANADIISASHTFTAGNLAVTATGAVGVGAEASFSASPSKVSASAGITDILGGSIKVSYELDGVKVTTSAKGEIDAKAQNKTEVTPPHLDEHE